MAALSAQDKSRAKAQKDGGTIPFAQPAQNRALRMLEGFPRVVLGACGKLRELRERGSHNHLTTLEWSAIGIFKIIVTKCLWIVHPLI